MSKAIEESRGQRIVIRFDARKCIHSRHCVLGQPEVSVPNAPGGTRVTGSRSAGAEHLATSRSATAPTSAWASSPNDAAGK